MQITFNIDKRGYTKKPDRKTAGLISYNVRQQSGQKTMEPGKLLEFITAGYTFTPAAIGGNIEEWNPKNEQGIREKKINPATGAEYSTTDFWQSQQIIVADIDNERKDKTTIDIQLTPAAALDACKAAGLDPFCIYKTFSNTEEHHKFRVMLLLAEQITEFEKAADYIGRFAALFNDAIAEQYKAAGKEPENCADTSIEPVKLIFGGRKDAIIYTSESITALDKLEALPKPLTIAPVSPRKEKTANNPHKYTSTLEGQTDSELILSALDAIPPESLDYKEWLTIAAAANYAGIDYADFDAWSSRDTSTNENGKPRYNEQANYKTWNSFTNNKAKPATAGSIFFHAQRNGWNFPTIDKEHFTAEKWEQIEKEMDDYFAAAEPAAPDPVPQEAYNPENMTEPAQQNMQEGAEQKAPPALFISAADYYTNKQYNADIAELKKYAGRKMGLHDDIDRYLTLYPGLAILGGQASLGKTTFCVNVAMQLLERGEHVLYFALEQTAQEIYTKIAARHLYLNNYAGIDNLQIKNGTALDDDAINDELSKLAGNLENFYIIDCDFESTAADIIAIAQQYTKEHDVKPIVIIDYLQIIAPPADFKGSKQDYIDENLKALKKWQKNEGLYVLLISSFNRANNYKPVSYESFLHTSAIEYTCDYVFGLQLQLLDPENKDFYIREGIQGGQYDKKDFEMRKAVHEAQDATPKKVQFVSLKNRNGKQFFKANFDYYPAHDYFRPDYTAQNYSRASSAGDPVIEAIKRASKPR